MNGFWDIFEKVHFRAILGQIPKFGPNQIFPKKMGSHFSTFMVP